jgi:hypothetical protein
VHYVDCRGGAKNFEEILCLIRDGEKNSGSLIRQPFDYAAFTEFNQLVAKLQSLRQRRAAAGPLPGADELIDQLFQAFRDVLQKTATAHVPLIIVLDHFKAIDPNDVRLYLWPHLFARIADLENDHLRLILAVTPAEYESYLPRDQDHLFECIDVPVFSKEQFQPLVREFFGRLNKHPLPDVIAVYDKRLKEVGVWKPKELVNLRGILEQWPGGGFI